MAGVGTVKIWGTRTPFVWSVWVFGERPTAEGGNRTYGRLAPATKVSVRVTAALDYVNVHTTRLSGQCPAGDLLFTGTRL
jgi:hypothetical protein